MPKQTITEEMGGQTSDHLPREMEICFGEDSSSNPPVRVATWNMLNLCHSSDPNKPSSFSNNPFNHQETLDEYKARFTQQLENLQKMMQSNDVILLQEVDFFYDVVIPTTLKGKNRKALEEKKEAFQELKDLFLEKFSSWGIIESEDVNKSHKTKKMLTLYNASSLEHVADSTKAVLPITKEVTKKDGSKLNLTTYAGLESRFTQTRGGKEITVVNIHLDYAHKNYAAEIPSYADSIKGPLIMAGDTNHDDLPNTFLFGPASSFDSKSTGGKDGKNLEATSLDGFVVKGAKNERVTATEKDGFEFKIEGQKNRVTSSPYTTNKTYENFSGEILQKSSEKSPNKKSKNTATFIPKEDSRPESEIIAQIDQNTEMDGDTFKFCFDSLLKKYPGARVAEPFIVKNGEIPDQTDFGSNDFTKKSPSNKSENDIDILPINTGHGHWTIVILDHKKKNITCFDPKGNFPQTLGLLKDDGINLDETKLKSLLLVDGLSTNYQVHNACVRKVRDVEGGSYRTRSTGNVQKEEDSTNCGAYCIKFAKDFVGTKRNEQDAGMVVKSLEKTDILDFRQDLTKQFTQKAKPVFSTQSYIPKQHKETAPKKTHSFQQKDSSSNDPAQNLQQDDKKISQHIVKKSSVHEANQQFSPASRKKTASHEESETIQTRQQIAKVAFRENEQEKIINEIRKNTAKAEKPSISKSEVFKYVETSPAEKLSKHCKINNKENLQVTIDLLEREEKEKGNVFSNKLARALNRLRDDKKDSDEKQTWNSLTTLDKKVLTEFYNVNHPSNKIDFNSLYENKDQYGKIAQGEERNLRKILEYSTQFIPNSSIKNPFVAQLKEKPQSRNL